MKRCRALALLALLLIWVSIPLGVAAEESSTVIGDDYVLEPGEIMDQDLVIVGGTALLSEGSMAAGDVAVMGGELIVEGEVHGDIVAFGGTLYLGEHARVTGNVISFGEFEKHTDAQVSGNIVEGAAVGGGLWKKLAEILENNPAVMLAPEIRGSIDAPMAPDAPGHRAANTARSVGNAIIKILFMAGLAMLVAHFLPERMGRVHRVMEDSALISAGVGLLTYIVAVLLMVILVVICIGIPVAIALALALVLLNALGWVAAGAWVGRQGVRITKLKIESALWIAALGTAFITIVEYVPCLGWLMSLALGSWAIGAILLSRLGTTVDTTWAPVVGPAMANAEAPQANVAPPATVRDDVVESGANTVPSDDPLAELGLPDEPDLDDIDLDLDVDVDVDLDDDGDDKHGTRKLN